MANRRSLQLFVLRHPDLEQAAWVRATTSLEASRALCNVTDIPVITPNDYGWVSSPDEKQHTDAEERPLPHWEYLTSVNGRADLKGLPKYLRALQDRAVPRDKGQVVFGKVFRRTTPLDLRSLPVASIAGKPEVYHSGYPEPYRIVAAELTSHHNGSSTPISTGKAAILALSAEEGAQRLESGDIIRIRVKGEEDDYIVIGQVACKAVLLNILDIRQVDLA